jgi:hypothetical protein
MTILKRGPKVLSKENFAIDHLMDLAYQHPEIDLGVLEKTIYAFGLLDALARNATFPFIFKGGTSLLLVLPKPMRLSTDIDIVFDGRKKDLLPVLYRISSVYPFQECEEDERNQDGRIVKSHYKMTYASPLYGIQDTILLDVLFEKNNYAKTLPREIKNDLLLTMDPPSFVTTPDADSLLGDKLTAFVPRSIGIQPVKVWPSGRKTIKRVEVLKQFFDVATLFDVAKDIKAVQKSYEQIAQAEFFYRQKEVDFALSLRDSFDSALLIFRNGKGDSQGLYRRDLSLGLADLPRFIFGMHLGPKEILEAASKVVLLTASLIAGFDPFERKLEDQKPLPAPYSDVNAFQHIFPSAFNRTAKALRLLNLDL